MLPDRVHAMCADLFQHLLDTGGPHQKTIIFCVRDSHATMVAQEMNNLYQAWCRQNSQWPVEYYAFQCTGNPNLRPPAADLIPEFRSSKASHFLATTVDLLSTGVDIPNLENVAFFQYLQSPIEFYQRVGRGTRTGEPRGSPHRTSRRFTTCGRFDDMPVEECEQRLAARLTEEAPTLDDLRVRWIWPDRRRELLEKLPGDGAAVRLIRVLREQDECDLYDVLAELGYGVAARSRAAP